MNNAIMIDPKDNVAVAIESVAKGETVRFICNGQIVSLTALEDITIYHKLAVSDIAKGMPIIKYGEHIGIASRSIKAGAHVHIHNVEGHRENLEIKEQEEWK